MKVYISHCLDDKSHFDNIVDALEQEGVPYWSTDSLRPGAYLSKQLQTAIEESELCIFVATFNSVSSQWCGAEPGAFWGAKKPVFIYLADSSLEPERLPKQFQGHFVERRISKIVKAVKKCLVEENGEIPDHRFYNIQLFESWKIENGRILEIDNHPVRSFICDPIEVFEYPQSKKIRIYDRIIMTRKKDKIPIELQGEGIINNNIGFL